MRILPYAGCESAAAFRADFGALPEGVRAGPWRRGLLGAAACEKLIEAPYPSPREFWLCYDAGRPAGGISANVSAARPDTGYFGLLEFDTKLAGAGESLLAAACGWLRQRGVARILGPVAFNTWFPYRFRLADGEPRIFDWEPCNPPDYVAAVENAGFRIDERYNSTAFADLEAVASRFEPDYEKALQEGFRFEPFGTASAGALVPTLHRLSHAAFVDNYLFEPIPEALFADAYIGLAGKGRPVRGWLLSMPRGEAAGFLYTFIDREGGETIAVLKTIGVVPELRGRRLSNALVCLGLKDAVAARADYAVAALVHAGIQSESYAQKGSFLWRHEYAVWRKEPA